MSFNNNSNGTGYCALGLGRGGAHSRPVHDAEADVDGVITALRAPAPQVDRNSLTIDENGIKENHDPPSNSRSLSRLGVFGGWRIEGGEKRRAIIDRSVMHHLPMILSSSSFLEVRLYQGRNRDAIHTKDDGCAGTRL